jgi:Bifunctional DNA primase/polymerase, N-terminal
VPRLWHACAMEQARQQDPAEVLALRHKLRAAGYSPIPLYGKTPPVYGKNNKRKGLDGWQNLQDVTREQIEMWSLTWPDAYNTGVLTRHMPVLDLDILNEEAARAVEDHIRGHFEEGGYVLTRIGRPPKRAIPFRTDEPFEKILVNLIAPNGSAGEKIEFLADGQQLVVFGVHPETKRPYRWHGGEPGSIAREDLPYIREDEARRLVDEIVELLVRDFGYSKAPERPKKRRDNGGDSGASGGAEDWQFLFANIREGRELHDSLRDLAAKMVKSGMNPGAVVNQLRALMKESSAPHDARWQERYDDIPRAVESAEGLQDEIVTPPPNPTPTSSRTLEDTLKVFEKWLILPDQTPIYAVLGAIAANYLDGDPVWLGVIAPPSSAKTEILNATALLPHAVQCATVTPAGLLSGTPKKQYDKGAKGGLLRQIGDFGILVLKDFGSVLSMHAETKAETLAALREIYDGAWTRHLGSDGGRTLAWKGKVGLIFAATGVIDSHHAVIGSMGDRFLFSRLAPTPGQAQFDRALEHIGAGTKQMRKELAEAVAQLFAGRKAAPCAISKDEIARIGAAISLIVRLRGAVARDPRTREVDAIYGAEGPARMGLALERLLAGLDTLGVAREKALAVVLSVAMDSAPPQRRAAYDCVRKHGNLTTADVAVELGLPSVTVRRVLEDLVAYRLIERQSLGQGKADQWTRVDWEAAERAAP